MRNLNFIKSNPAIVFLVFMIIWSWSSWSIIFSIFPMDMENNMPSPIAVILVGLGASPSLIGIIFTRIYDGKGSIRSFLSRLLQWKVNFKFYLLALFMVPIISAIAIAFQLFLRGSTLESNIIGRIGVAIGAGIFAGLIEEFGWRGFALNKLLIKYNLLKSAIITGLFWGLWHTAINYLGLRQYGLLVIPILVLVGPIQLTAFTVLMAFIYKRTKGSILLMVLSHTSISGSAIIFTLSNSTAINYLRYQFIYTALVCIIATIVVLLHKKLFKEQPSVVASE